MDKIGASFLFSETPVCFVADITAAPASPVRSTCQGAVRAVCSLRDGGSPWCSSGPPNQGLSHHRTQEQGSWGALGTAPALGVRHLFGGHPRPHSAFSLCLASIAWGHLVPLHHFWATTSFLNMMQRLLSKSCIFLVL